MPIFCVKSVNIYTGQKKFTQIRGMQTIMAHVQIEYAEHTILLLFVHLSRAASANDFELFVHVALFGTTLYISLSKLFEPTIMH